MKTVFFASVVAGLAAVAGADTVANWDYNDQGLEGGGFGFLTSDFPYSADVGSGEMTLANFDGTESGGLYTYIQSFSGTNLLALDGNSGGSFAFQGGPEGSNNGAQAIFSFDGSSWADLAIDFARRGTGTGFDSLTLEMFDGTASLGFAAEIDGPQSSTWTANNFDLSALDGVADASIVFTFDGSTSTSGNNRIDNVTISGIVPAPGAAALLGLGGLVATRRRRA